MEKVLDKFIEEEVKKAALRDKITGFLVKKKKRGTYQAFEESGNTEKEIIENVIEYMHKWLLEEFIDGSLKEKVENEIKDSIHLELARLGYDSILKK